MESAWITAPSISLTDSAANAQWSFVQIVVLIIVTHAMMLKTHMEEHGLVHVKVVPFK